MLQEKSAVVTLDCTAQARRAGVSVVIVVWNAKRYVVECLNSLRDWCASAYTEVIIVDNASTDGTAELVAEMFPEFTLIRNTTNLGFATANNIGISQSTGEFVCLVNSDVKFTSDCISPMLTYMGANPKLSLLGPKMLAPTDLRPRRKSAAASYACSGWVAPDSASELNWIVSSTIDPASE